MLKVCDLIKHKVIFRRGLRFCRVCGEELKVEQDTGYSRIFVSPSDEIKVWTDDSVSNAVTYRFENQVGLLSALQVGLC